MEHDLRFAIERNELELYFQPQMNPATGIIDSCESLLRWHHPQRGLVSPLEFIPVAEESGQIYAIGEWVLRQACQQAKKWQLSGIECVVAVNISAAQFHQPGFAEQVLRAIGSAGLTPQLLELEITETVTMDMGNVTQVTDTMSLLKKWGIGLVIDDLGTGFSSLSYIQHFPLDKLKIDRAFVKDIGFGDDGSLAQSIMLLARNLQLETVVEGVETDYQRSFFLDQECSLIQGYYYSKPLPAGDFMAILEKARMHKLIKSEQKNG